MRQDPRGRTDRRTPPVDGVGQLACGRLGSEREAERGLEVAGDDRHVVLVAHTGGAVELLGRAQDGPSRVEGGQAGASASAIASSGAV